MKTVLMLFILICSCILLQAQVTSVGLAAPTAVFDVSGSPVTTTGTLTLTFDSQSQNLFFASPDGMSGTPSFRSILATDLPIVGSGTQGIISNNTGSTQVFGDGDKEFPDKLFLSNGTTANPSLAFSGAHTTGLSWVTGEAINGSFSGTQRFQFTSLGKLVLSDCEEFDPKLDFNIYHDSNDDSPAQDGGINITTYGGTDCVYPDCHFATVTGRTASGSKGTPQATVVDQGLIELSGKGYTGSAFETSNRGVFGIYAAETHDGSGQGTYALVRTTPINSTTIHTSMLIDPEGNAGLTHSSFNTSLPNGWDATADSRFFSIESNATNKDAGILMQNASGNRGLNVWFDYSGNFAYIDDIRNDQASGVGFRFRTAGTPEAALTMLYNDAGDHVYINAGKDVTPDNLFTVGDNSEFQVDVNGKVAKYNNIATVSNGVPAEYAIAQATNKSAAQAATTIYTTPAADGFYRISWVCTITTQASTSSILGPFTVSYTGATDNVVKTWPSNNINNFNQCATNSTATGVISGCMTIYAKASTNIQFTVGYTSSGVTSMVYDYNIVCEKL